MTDEDEKYLKNREELSIQWVIGGMQGGNCWGGEANQSVSAEPEPEFEEFDKILEKVCPSISFIQYKRLVQECVVVGEGSGYGEYYGNYTDYGKKSCKIRTLAEALKKRGLWRAK
jgi:hypothetical protein